MSSVIETVLLEDKDIMYSHQQRVMDFHERVIPLISLQDELHVPKEENSESDTKQYQSVVVVSKGDKLTGFIVDSFIGK